MRDLMRFTLLCCVLLVAVPGVHAEDEVYRWVDEDGVVHFGDKAGEHPEAELIKVDPAADNGLGVSVADDSVETEESDNPEVSPAQQQRDERAEKRKDAAEKQQQLAAACQRARENVAQLEPSPRVLVTNDDGTVSRMDDDRRLALLSEAKTFIAQNCN